MAKIFMDWFTNGRRAKLGASPATTSLLVIIGYYMVTYGFLQPGYAINDDLKIISIAAGYPGVQPAPFLIFSNVLLGFLLTPLYSLHSSLNWEMLLFGTLNLLSLWTLLYIVLLTPIAKSYKILGTGLLLACAAYYILNFTFTSTAALACFAGLMAVLAASTSAATRPRVLAACGVGLVFCGCLIRVQMLLLVLPVVLAAVPFIYRVLRLPSLAIFVICAGVLVFSAFAFDRLYVRAHPEWNTYYYYNQVAQMLQDSHRLENMDLEIRRISWSKNDQELFARSFFPDAGVYSADRLRFLVDHVSGIGDSPLYAAQTLVARVTANQALPFLLVCLAVWLWSLAFDRWPYAWATVPVLVSASLAENFALIWAYKDPEYVLLSSLANTAILCILIQSWKAVPASSSATPHPRRGLATAATLACVIVAAMALGGTLMQSLLTSSDNLGKRTAYARVLADIDGLRADGKIAQDALIVSPAYGIPIHWSNPFLLDLPGISYLDTGWSTFSPPYEEALRRFGIDSLPEALYAKDNIYIITDSNFKAFLARYYQEHGNINVTFQILYTLDYPDRYVGHRTVELFKVARAQ